MIHLFLHDFNENLECIHSFIIISIHLSVSLMGFITISWIAIEPNHSTPNLINIG